MSTHTEHVLQWCVRGGLRLLQTSHQGRRSGANAARSVAGATARSRRAHSSFAHRGTAPGVDVAARRNVAVAITDRSTDTVQASSQSGQA